MFIFTKMKLLSLKSVIKKVLSVVLSKKLRFCHHLFFLCNLIKNIKIKFLYFYNKFVNRIKNRLYILLSGKKLGTYFNGHLLSPIIILNNKLLVDFLNGDEYKIQKFFWWMFKDTDEFYNYFGKEKLDLYESKLLKLIEKEGKSFPPFDKNFNLLLLSEEIILELYEEWKKEPDFFVYIISYYLHNYPINILDEPIRKRLEDKEEFMTIDLSPALFI